jgi:hypothetical protein
MTQTSLRDICGSLKAGAFSNRAFKPEGRRLMRRRHENSMSAPPGQTFLLTLNAHIMEPLSATPCGATQGLEEGLSLFRGKQHANSVLPR